MTKFLASVSTIEEAILAEQLGADIIDLKNPQTGALGAIETKIITEIVTALHPDSRVSATIGDLPLLPEIVIPAIQKTAKTGVDFIKIGLFDLDNLYACLDALSTTLNLADIALIGVMFADQSLNIDYLQD
ncbi:MAG TPA: hypothetical protein ENJ32_13515, partial [Crenotrichaceae bacterium]|nr:hypothetical protein [Crenotrichaceae bacterium]